MLQGLEEYRRGELSKALKTVSTSIGLNPSEASSYNLLGNIYAKLGKERQALSCYQRALGLNPHDIDTLYNIGSLYLKRGDIKSALDYLKRASELAPQRTDILINLGVAMTEAGILDEAEALLKKVVTINPNDPEGYINLGNCLRLMQRPDEALGQYKRALSLSPTDPDIYVNIGVVLRDALCIDNAIDYYKQAIVLNKDHAEAHFNLALALLMKGDFKKGWEEYQWRWNTPDFVRFLRPKGKQWDGRYGRYTLLLYSEQGFGDTLQFVRYIKVLTEKLSILLLCQRQLLRLLDGQWPSVRVLPADEPFGQYDYHCSLMDLPLILGTDLKSIPAEVPYIYQKEADILQWQGIMEDFKGHKKIGLIWTGSRTNKRANYRSCSLMDIQPLLSIRGIDFFYIGKEAPPSGLDQSLLRPIDLSGNIRDFADTAALLHHLDLVITIDTAVAHLAGAMGKPVWLMLHYSSDWRWMPYQTNSPWYPTMRIFRQKTFGDWKAVIDEIVDCLTQDI